MATARPPLRADDPVERLPGIGPKTSAALASIGVVRVLDLIFHLPRRYEDRSIVLTVDEALASTGAVLIQGRVMVRTARHVRRRLHITDGEIADNTGVLAIRWFNQRWIQDRVGEGGDARVYGTVGLGPKGRFQMVNPEVQLLGGSPPADEVVPVYPKLGPLAGKRLRNAITHALESLGTLADPLGADLRHRLDFPRMRESLRWLHQPTLTDGPDERREILNRLNCGESRAHRRLVFDELLAVSTVVAGHRARRRELVTRPVEISDRFRSVISKALPYRLTSAQNRVVDEILGDLAKPVPMARLVQGDVGCGKTVVAAMALLATLESGRQAALMAPTELLAEQLHRSIGANLEPMSHRPQLLTGSLRPARARQIRRGLASGSVRLVVGTHALFQDDVAFADLGLVVIDEQHRFGVAQRQRLLDKGQAPHLLVMTATPIPRSLALTLYGDLELSVIDELPPGRSPVRTEIRDSSARERVWTFLRSEIQAGGRAYIVFPLIEASEKLDAAAIGEHEATIRKALEGVRIGVLHGRQSRDERETVARGFRNGEIDLLLATTVIEVGVDVPAASVMVIESADRFGLSQLHQLRGRVGRGSRQSWCILITGENTTTDARRRLAVIQGTSDGFEIAEADLRHRGPGELVGHRQWGGEVFRFADLLRHHELVVLARETAADAARTGELEGLRADLLRYHPVGLRLSVS